MPYVLKQCLFLLQFAAEKRATLKSRCGEQGVGFHRNLRLPVCPIGQGCSKSREFSHVEPNNIPPNSTVPPTMRTREYFLTTVDLRLES
eukprot:3413337-Amphidinium_carterae.1